MGVGNETAYLGFTLNPNAKIKAKNAVGVYYYDFEAGAPGNRSIICKDNLKTLFGNKSIVGLGNIDLYRHVITFTPSNMSVGGGIRLVVYSSNNLKVNSLTDLKTLLGNTFEYPANGSFKNTESPLAYYITSVTETGYRYYVPDDVDSSIQTYPAGTWADTVTTI